MIGKVLAKQFGLTQFVVQTNLEDISHEVSLNQPQQFGNCVNWVLGHIVATRNRLLEILGEQPIWSPEEAKSYERGSPPIRNGTGAHKLEKILADFEKSQETIAAALSRRSDDEFSKQPQGSKETFAEWVAALSFHESYHTGQLGLLRRVIGREGKIQ